jgi:hypothetical protein
MKYLTHFLQLKLNYLNYLNYLIYLKNQVKKLI